MAKRSKDKSSSPLKRELERLTPAPPGRKRSRLGPDRSPQRDPRKLREFTPWCMTKGGPRPKHAQAYCPLGWRTPRLDHLCVEIRRHPGGALVADAGRRRGQRTRAASTKCGDGR